MNEPEHGHNIAECIEMADVRLENSGNLPDLGRQVGEFIDGPLGLTR